MNLAQGSMIGKTFRLERTLVEDETSIVVAAHSVAGGGRVAIRVLASGTSDVRFVTRFARAAEIQSDHVPRLLDVGSLADGRPYVVMEYVEGESLEQVLARGPIPVAAAVDYVLQASDAIAAAHALGVVHRKLRTSSLLVTPQGDGQQSIKVLNFGTPPQSRTAGSLGSSRIVAYMAPEQLADPQRVDFRCDIWALGVILYELLTGRRPFEARTPAALQKIILHSAPRPPHALRRDTPPELERVVLTCLERNPAQRFHSVNELATALAPFATPRIRTVTKLGARPRVGRRGGESRGIQAMGPPPQPIAPPKSEEDDEEDNPTLLRGADAVLPGESADSDAPFRKIMKDGRIEALVGDEVARVVRAKRVAAEAAALAQRAASMPAEEEPEDQADLSSRMTGFRSPGGEHQLTGATMPPPGARSIATRRLLLMVILVASVLTGLGVGAFVRILMLRDARERGRPAPTDTASSAQPLEAPP